MSTETTRKYPAPVYAAAAAGDLAYRQLRKLPARLTELRDRVSGSDIEFMTEFRELASGTNQRFDRLRAAARRRGEAALGEARSVYADLVARGERLVGGAAGARTPEIEEKAKPAKRARPAASK